MLSSPSVTRAAISMSRSDLQVEPGHLAVDPHQFVTHSDQQYSHRADRRSPSTHLDRCSASSVCPHEHRIDSHPRAADRRWLRRRRRRRWSSAPSSSTASSTRRAQVRIPLATVNRHGLVAGATGTGKTKSLQVIAEQLSAAGVPVVMADVKGDLSGLSQPGDAGRQDRPARHRHRRQLDADGVPRGVPVARHRRASGSRCGPRSPASGRSCCRRCWGSTPLRSRRSGLIFHWADQKGLPLLDLKDLRAVIQYLTSDEGKAGAQGPRRGVADHRGRDPARAGQPGGRGRRHLLRRAGTGAART